jgi:NAD(P)-dependent dehydrogenase (short-subunit alcohol dehydrogenase family)
MGPTAAMAEDDIDAVFAINVEVPFLLTAELAPAMAGRGKGAIVNVGTMAAEFGMPGTSLYGASFVHGAILAVDGGRTAA